jgi:hypothetical protein
LCAPWGDVTTVISISTGGTTGDDDDEEGWPAVDRHGLEVSIKLTAASIILAAEPAVGMDGKLTKNGRRDEERQEEW